MVSNTEKGRKEATEHKGEMTKLHGIQERLAHAKNGGWTGAERGGAKCREKKTAGADIMKTRCK